LIANSNLVGCTIGVPKLELLAQRIWDRAQKLGIPPDLFRDQVLTGKAHAPAAHTSRKCALDAARAGRSAGVIFCSQRCGS
jgi:hypothetical protein